MTRRLLPATEWLKLDGTALGPAWRAFSPESTQVVVVEDAAGLIVACWCLVTWAHVEGLWIADAHRKHTSVARHLLVGMRELCTERGIDAVVTNAETPDIASMVLQAGGHKLPGEAYVLPFAEPVRTYDALGASFHEQLFLMMPEAVHEDDPQHDRAVGRALYTGIIRGQIERAVVDYNAWATTAGYLPISYLGQQDNGAFVVDIVEAVVAIDASFQVTLLEARACLSAQP